MVLKSILPQIDLPCVSNVGRSVPQASIRNHRLKTHRTGEPFLFPGCNSLLAQPPCVGCVRSSRMRPFLGCHDPGGVSRVPGFPPKSLVVGDCGVPLLVSQGHDHLKSKMDPKQIEQSCEGIIFQ